MCVSESSSEAEAGPVGQALNMAAFLDKHSGAWGGFWADGRALQQSAEASGGSRLDK